MRPYGKGGSGDKKCQNNAHHENYENNGSIGGIGILESILPACKPVVIKGPEDKLGDIRKKCEQENNQEDVIIFEEGLIITHIFYESGGVSDAPKIYDI